MSTKVYSGFRVNAGSALANLNLLSAIKPVVQALVDRRMAVILAERIAFEVDRFCVLRQEENLGRATELPADWADQKTKLVSWSIRMTLLDEQAECRAGPRRHPAVDCDVELFLRADPAQGTLLGYLQEEGVGVRKMLTQTPGIEDFCYWNNSDKPEELTDEEWDARGRLWDTVLIDSVACLSLKFEPNPLFTAIENDAHLDFPAHLIRAKRLAMRKLESDAIARFRAGLKAQGKDDPTGFAWASKLMREVREGVETGQLAHELRTLTEQYMHIIPADLHVYLNKTFEEIPTQHP